MLSCLVTSNSSTPWTVAHQSPLPMGYYRLEYWSGLPFPLQGIFPTWELNLHLLHWQADSLPMSHLRNPFSNCPLESCNNLIHTSNRYECPFPINAHRYFFWVNLICNVVFLITCISLIILTSFTKCYWLFRFLLF